MSDDRGAEAFDGEWLAIGQQLDDLANHFDRGARAMRKRARNAFERAGIRAPEPAEHKKVDRILWNKRDEDIDEIVIHDATVHVEQMDVRCWWIGVYKDDEKQWSGNFIADSRGRMRFTEQDCEIEWDRDDSHER